MEELLERMKKVLLHVTALNSVFEDKVNFRRDSISIHERYNSNSIKFHETIEKLSFYDKLYSEKERRMVLADFFEYIFLGRGFYSMQVKASLTKEARGNFIKGILYFVNLLMAFESITVKPALRKKVLKKLESEINEIKAESQFNNLKNSVGPVGAGAWGGGVAPPKALGNYLDSLLPKTAGGLWHELLAYIFMLRNDCGYIVPLVLTQRFFSLDDHLKPPDFFILTHDKKIFGIEVGTKKEIQSGAFSVKTAIPTATLDTEMSRNSDRCPACGEWIQFCDYVVNNYSDVDKKLDRIEVRCLKNCTIYTPDEIASGICPFTKYQRPNRIKEYAGHKFANSKHYHYQCVLKGLNCKLLLYGKSLLLASKN